MSENVLVATNVCGTINTIPVNLDCSLCALGFPQAGGTLGLTFYDDCDAVSRWLGPTEEKLSGFQCPRPAMNAEPVPNTWIATGTFNGIAVGSCVNQYRTISTLTAMSTTQISISVIVYVLRPYGAGNAWITYATFSETLTELANVDTTAYRQRNYLSPVNLSFTPNAIGGVGDAKKFKIRVTLLSMKIGCSGAPQTSVPNCGFWDGTQWLTCLRGFISSTANYLRREFTQLGFNASGCGGTDACGCDQIVLTATSPPTGNTIYNSGGTFVTKYGVLGLPGAIEAIGATQELQVCAPTECGVDIVVKQVNGGSIYICTNDNNAGWVVSLATVAQSSSPRILTATRTGFVVYLYTLNFPNSEILSTECGNGGAYPTPSAGDPWWCTSTGCVQSPLQPTSVLGGPYATLGSCVAGCPQNTGEYWCLYGYCFQSETQPAGATGPYLTSGACASACGEVVMVYHCGDAGCTLISKGEAITLGYTYWNTLAECEASCIARWFCRPEGCATSHLNPPPDALLGPFDSEALCLASTCTSNTGPGYYCIGGDTMVCGYYSARPYNAIGPKYSTNMACVMACHPSLGVMEGSQPSPPLDRPEMPRGAKQSIIQRISIPCVNLGLPLESPNSCGCGTAVKHSCLIYGECRKFGGKDGESMMLCINCKDYSPKDSS